MPTSLYWQLTWYYDFNEKSLISIPSATRKLINCSSVWMSSCVSFKFLCCAICKRKLNAIRVYSAHVWDSHATCGTHFVVYWGETVIRSLPKWLQTARCKAHFVCYLTKAKMDCTVCHDAYSHSHLHSLVVFRWPPYITNIDMCTHIDLIE